jgi:transposase
MPAPRKYPQELRERGVRLVFESGRPVAHVARDLGVHRETLRLWVRQAEAEAGTRSDRLTSAKRERLKQLERENRELRRANEILKAAMGRPGARSRPRRAPPALAAGSRFI